MKQTWKSGCGSGCETARYATRIFAPSIQPGATFSIFIVLHWPSLLSSTEANMHKWEYATANVMIG